MSPNKGVIVKILMHFRVRYVPKKVARQIFFFWLWANIAKSGAQLGLIKEGTPLRLNMPSSCALYSLYSVENRFFTVRGNKKLALGQARKNEGHHFSIFEGIFSHT